MYLCSYMYLKSSCMYVQVITRSCTICLQVTPYLVQYFPVTFSAIQPYVSMCIAVYMCVLYDISCIDHSSLYTITMY